MSARFRGGAYLGGDGSKADRQRLDQRVAERLLETRGQAAAADQAASGNANVEIAEDAALGQSRRPLLEGVELSAALAAADHVPIEVPTMMSA